MKINHGFPPLKDEKAEILILGSFPSVNSRKASFFYMHKQNRFYPLLSNIYNDDFVNCSIEEKTRLLKKHHIALYDVIESCTIVGSKDSSIKDIVYANITEIINNTDIKKIICNGRLAYKLFRKHYPELENICYYLPSTSPANAKTSLKELIDIYKTIIS